MGSSPVAVICKLLILGTLGMPGYTQPKWQYQLVEDFHAYLQAKNTLYHSLLSWDITFKESCNLICWQHFGLVTWELEFCQIRDLWWIINNNTTFHFRLFPSKTNDKIFHKNQKNLIQGHFGLFLPKFEQKWIFLKKKRTLSVFKYSNYLPSCQKSEKN